MFNGIKGLTNVPGEIPWEIVVLYYVFAPVTIFLIGKRTGALKKFTTLDWVYIGIGGALGTVWEFYIGTFLDRLVPAGVSSFVDPGFWGRMIILMIIVGVVRKTGAGMLSLLIFTILSDLFHYGFGGEPLYFFYEALTYGLFLDLLISITGGRPFGLGSRPSPVIGALQGAVISLLWALPDPLIYDAFYRPFIYGAVVDWGEIIFKVAMGMSLIWIAGAIGGLAAHRVEKVIQV
jgi:hypothetical protein